MVQVLELYTAKIRIEQGKMIGQCLPSLDLSYILKTIFVKRKDGVMQCQLVKIMG